MPVRRCSFSYDPQLHPDVHRWIERDAGDTTLSERIRTLINADAGQPAAGKIDRILAAVYRIEVCVCGRTEVVAEEALPEDVLKALDGLGE